MLTVESSKRCAVLLKGMAIGKVAGVVNTCGPRRSTSPPFFVVAGKKGEKKVEKQKVKK